MLTVENVQARTRVRIERIEKVLDVLESEGLIRLIDNHRINRTEIKEGKQ